MSSGLRSKFTIPRFSYGVSSRLQRSHPSEIMKFHDWEIPPKVIYPILVICCGYSQTSNINPFQTPVGMTSVHIHHNEEIFPESYKFKPERWLENRPERAPPLDRYLVAFSKGSRQCIGMKYVVP